MATFDATFGNDTQFDATFSSDNSMAAGFGSTQFIEIGHYESLPDKPIINGHTIIGDKVSVDYDLQDRMDVITPQDIDNLFYGRQ